MKVNLLDKNLRKQFAKWCAALTGVLSAVLIFIDIPDENRFMAGCIYLVFLIMLYIICCLIANNQRKASIKIGNTTVDVKAGDIFAEEGLKAIAFNEYFDTQVDDVVIAKASLNGQVITKHIIDVESLDKTILEDKNLQKNIIADNTQRDMGKTTKYKLGSSILINDEFVLTAFSRFNENNEAEITIQEYVNFLLSFWNEINRLYAQRPVTVPIFGAGITRFKNGFEDIDINELLQIMIWTFKISKIKFVYPAKLTILIHESKIKQVNLYELKENE